jgi:hypothetical protein
MDTKQLAFELKILGLSIEQGELAKVNIALKELHDNQKKIDESFKKGKITLEQYVAQTAANTKATNENKTAQKELTKTVDSAEGSLNRMRAELIKLKSDYANASAEVREKMAPAINKLNTEISKAEQAIGVHTRNVGNYGSAFVDFGNKIRESIGSLVTGGAVIALVAAAFEKVKEAVMSTTGAINALNVVGEVSRQIFYDLVTTGRLNVQNLQDAIIATKILNALRVEEYADQLDISKLERELQEQRLLASDMTKTDTERLEALNKVRKLESEETKIKVDHLKKELEAVNMLIQKRPEDEKLLARGFALLTKINEAYAEEDRSMKRVETTRTGIMKRQAEATQKEYDDLMKLADEQIEIDRKAAEEAKKIADDKANEELKNLNEFHAIKQGLYDEWDKAEQKRLDDKWNFDLDLAKKQFTADKKAAKDHMDIVNDNIEKEKAADERLAEFEVRTHLETQTAKYKVVQSISSLINAVAGKSKALQKAALVAEKVLAIAEIVISTARANTIIGSNAKASVLPGPFYFLRQVLALAMVQPIIALNKISEAFNIATVIAATATGLAGFARGGKINRGVPINTGTKDDTLIAVNKTETVITQDHVRMLGGSGAMRRIRVPGYEMGGYAGQMAPDIPSAGLDYDRFERMMRTIEVRLDINKLNKSQSELSVITEAQRI